MCCNLKACRLQQQACGEFPLTISNSCSSNVNGWRVAMRCNCKLVISPLSLLTFFGHWWEANPLLLLLFVQKEAARLCQLHTNQDVTAQWSSGHILEFLVRPSLAVLICGCSEWFLLQKCFEVDLAPFFTWKHFRCNFCSGAAELKATGLFQQPPTARRYALIMHAQCTCCLCHGRMPCPLTVASNISTPNRFAELLNSIRSIWVALRHRKSMDHILRRSYILQVLKSIVAFVSIFVVYLAMSFCGGRSEKGKGYQAVYMSENWKRTDCYPRLAVSALGNMTPVNNPRLWRNSPKRTDHSSMNFKTWLWIQHWPPLLSF